LPAFFQHYIGYSAMGILFSAPALVVYYAAFVQLTKRRLSIPLVKLVIAAIAVLSIPVTMRVVGIDVARLEVMYLPLTYMAVVAITSFVYKLKASPTEDPTLKSAATH
ncbi:MAG TPA: hypothetical protein VEY71_09795, partial [Chitinophagales bacterium]|nr:hypothetical protein [Chitinophagales bacterium]